MTGASSDRREWRVPRIETYPRVVAFTCTSNGKLVLFALFAGLMWLHARGIWIAKHDLWLWLTVAAATISLAGRHRHVALLLATVAFMVPGHRWFEIQTLAFTLEREGLSGAFNPEHLRLAGMAACVPLAAIAMLLARRFRDHPLARRPVFVQHLLFFALMVVASSNLLHGLPQVLLWVLLVVFGAYFWFLAYALIDQRRRRPSPPLIQFATFTPFAFPTQVPMGSGIANWRSVQAGTEEELAVTQLKALKLLAWAYALRLLAEAYSWVFHVKLAVPALEVNFARFLSGNADQIVHGVPSIILNLPDSLFELAIAGHIFIAVARLAGFRLLRNTWRPLSSRTVAEFWNRYFYYFKELLVHVYFYPTYLRFFKKYPRLRIAFATFVAVGFGNFVLHWMGAPRIAAEQGFLSSLYAFQSYALYCVVLSGGIIISQLRNRKPDPDAGWFRGRFLPSLGVLTFFCLVTTLDSGLNVTVQAHFDFLAYVSGIDRLFELFR